MKSQVLFEHGERQRGEMLAFVSLGIAGMVMILFAVSAMSELMAGRDQVATAFSDKLPVGPESATIAPLAASNPEGRPGGVIDPPVPATNGSAACSPGAVVTVGDGSRIVRPARAGFTGPRAWWKRFINF